MEPNFDMLIFMQKKLNNIKDLEQKKMASEILNDIFLTLYKMNESKYDILQENVRNELRLPTNQYVVYSTFASIDEINYQKSYFYPISSEDVKKSSISLELKENTVLETIFIKRDIIEINKIISENPYFSGTIITDKGPIEAVFKLELSKRYFEEVHQLYRDFIFNGIKWHSLNVPILYHFYDIVIIKMHQIIPNYIFIRIDSFFLDADFIIREKLIPLWNVENFSVTNDEFPDAIPDGDLCKFKFDLDKLDKNSGFIAQMASHIIAARHLENVLIITSSIKKRFSCNLRKFHKLPEKSPAAVSKPIFSNCEKDTFGGRLTNHYGEVKTRAEVKRILYSLGATENFILNNIQVLYDENFTGETYELNLFTEDEIIGDNISKILSITFEQKKNLRWYDRDLLSYYCSQLQLVYPEYKVKGVLINGASTQKREIGEGLPI